MNIIQKSIGWILYKFYFGEKWKKNDIKNKIRKINLNVIFLTEQQKYKSITLIMLEK